jgi:hypothetical protein
MFRTKLSFPGWRVRVPELDGVVGTIWGASSAASGLADWTAPRKDADDASVVQGIQISWTLLPGKGVVHPTYILLSSGTTQSIKIPVLRISKPGAWPEVGLGAGESCMEMFGFSFLRSRMVQENGNADILRSFSVPLEFVDKTVRNGVYSIVNAATGYVLDLTSSSLVNGLASSAHCKTRHSFFQSTDFHP